MSGPAPTRNEIENLLAVARRELADAAVHGLSNDGRFEHAYAAALALGTVVVRSSGERIHGADHHRLTFEALADANRGTWRETAGFLQHCRRRRNVAMYDRPGGVSAEEAREIVRVASALRAEVERWLRREHAELVSS